MDRSLRLTLFFILGLFLGGFAVSSFASTLVWYATASGSGNQYSTGTAACAVYFSGFPYQLCGSPTYSNGYRAYNQAYAPPGNTCANTTYATQCAWGSLSSSSSCPSGTVDDGTGSGNCVPVPCTSGQTQSSGFYDMGTSPTAMPQHSGCDGGCGTSFNGTFPVSRALVGGVYHYFGQGSFVKDGSTCSTGSPSPSSAGSSTPAPTCASGQSMGEVNGQTVCLGSGGTPTNPNTTPTPTTKTDSPTVTNADGSTTKTSTQQNPDGSTTTTTTNTGTDGTVTTSSITVNPDGTSQDPMRGFCQQNPGSPMCKAQDAFCQSNPNSIMCKDHTFSGSCAATSCSGDAIECQIAQEQAKRNCVLYDTATPLSDLGNQVASGADPQAGAISAALAPSSTDVQAIFTSAQGARWLGSADLADIPISTQFGQFVIPMSNWSNLFRVMGYILVSVSLVIAVRMVSSTVTA